MRFVSEEQRKAVFARIRKGGSSTKSPKTPKAPKTPGPTDDLFTRLEVDNPASPFYNPSFPLPNGPGIPGWEGGSVTLTGGAIYNTPSSDWFINNNKPAVDYGSYNGAGVGPYELDFSLTPAQAAFLYRQNTGLGVELYNLMAHGIQPGAVGMNAPYATPGQLKFGVGTGWDDMAQEQAAAERIRYTGTYGSAGPENLYGFGIPASQLNQKKPKKKKSRPTWIFGGGL